MTTTTKLTRLAIRYGLHLTRHIPSVFSRLLPIALRAGVAGQLFLTQGMTAVIDMASGRVLRKI